MRRGNSSVPAGIIVLSLISIVQTFLLLFWIPQQKDFVPAFTTDGTSPHLSSIFEGNLPELGGQNATDDHMALQRLQHSNATHLLHTPSPLNRTAVVLTTKGIFNDCEVYAIRHLVQSSPGMDVWVLTNPLWTLTGFEQNVSQTNIRGIPGLHQAFQLNESDQLTISRFNGVHSGTSKPSMVQFLDRYRDRYDFAWHLESDVFYSGPWIEVFDDEGRDFSTDFLTVSLKPWTGNRENTNRCKVHGKPCSGEHTVFQTGWQVARLSSRFATTLWNALESSAVVGHHEALVFPFAEHYGFTIRQIDPFKIQKMSFGMGNVKYLDKFQPEKGVFVHPVKCKGYSNTSNATADFAKYSDRPPLSQLELWQNRAREIKLLPIYIVSSNGRDIDIFEDLYEKGLNVTKVSSTTGEMVSQSIQEGRLSIWNESRKTSMRRHPHNLEFIAKTVTLCRAVLEAYQSGAEKVLVVLEKASFLPRSTLVNLPKELSIGSKRHGRWELLALRNMDAHKFYTSYPGGWESLHGLRHDTAAFVLHRRGMASILSKVQDNPTGGWTIPPISKPLKVLLNAEEAYMTKNPMIPNEKVLHRSSLPLSTTIVFSKEYL